MPWPLSVTGVTAPGGFGMFFSEALRWNWRGSYTSIASTALSSWQELPTLPGSRQWLWDSAKDQYPTLRPEQLCPRLCAEALGGEDGGGDMLCTTLPRRSALASRLWA